MIAAITEKMEEHGWDGALAGYKGLAIEMNDFVDIFNGKKGYGSLVRSCFADPAPPCIRRVRIVAALATFLTPVSETLQSLYDTFVFCFLVSIPCVTSTR